MSSFSLLYTQRNEKKRGKKRYINLPETSRYLASHIVSPCMRGQGAGKPWPNWYERAFSKMAHRARRVIGLGTTRSIENKS